MNKNDPFFRTIETIDLVHSKAWSGKNWKKVATASSFTIVYEKSEGKSTKCSITKTFPKRNNLPCCKYVIYMYFYLVTYFVPAILYLSVRFLCISILKFPRQRMHMYFALKKWWMHYFDDVIKCHALARTWSIVNCTLH